MMILGIFECQGVGWFYKRDIVLNRIGSLSYNVLGIGYWVVVIFSLIIGFHALDGGYWGFLIFFLLEVAVFVASYMLAKS